MPQQAMNFMDTFIKARPPTVENILSQDAAQGLYDTEGGRRGLQRTRAGLARTHALSQPDTRALDQLTRFAQGWTGHQAQHAVPRVLEGRRQDRAGELQQMIDKIGLVYPQEKDTFQSRFDKYTAAERTHQEQALSGLQGYPNITGTTRNDRVEEALRLLRLIGMDPNTRQQFFGRGVY